MDPLQAAVIIGAVSLTSWGLLLQFVRGDLKAKCQRLDGEDDA